MVRLSLLLLLLASPYCVAELQAPECEAATDYVDISPPQGDYASGLLWRVQKSKVAPSYLFGTIHVADPAITNLPLEVATALDESTVFAMELVPEAEEMQGFARRMYFDDGTNLRQLMSAELYAEVERLLAIYHLPAELVAQIKPWAAFLTMSYPPEFGQVLDMQLLQIARRNGAEVSGLETLHEQISIFEAMSLDKQLKLLSDTACHYDEVKADFETMKDLYLRRDLAGLYAFGQRYSQADADLYNELLEKLLLERNHTMVKRMQSLLQQGKAFVAIGAMHLAGEHGVLSLLEAMGYEISPVY